MRLILGRNGSAVGAYLCHGVRPAGFNDDDASGSPPGTALLRAVDMLKHCGIPIVYCHSLPPDPSSDMGQFMADKCYANLRNWGTKAAQMVGHDCPYELLNRGNEQIYPCDGSYEAAIRKAGLDVHLVTGTSINAIAMYLKAASEYDSDGVIVNGPHHSHPILKYVDELYPTIEPDGRSMDIWHPKVVDVLAYAYEGLCGIGRPIGAFWLTLGGGFIWGEASWISEDGIYPLRSDYAREALGCKEDINFGQEENRYYSDIIVAREGQIAEQLVDRLKGQRDHFYFQTRMFPRTAYRPGIMQAGLNGIADELCERFGTRTDIKVHLIMSHAWNAQTAETDNAMKLAAKYPNIDFIAGVGWETRLRTSGMAQLLRFGRIEVQMGDEDQWRDLPDAMMHLQQLAEKIA